MTPLLRLTNLHTHFPLKGSLFNKEKSVIRAVDGVDLTIHENEVLGLVGESGCGKSTLGKTALRLIEPTKGTIHLYDKEITTLSYGDLRPLRKNIQIIFQDPGGSLNPRMTIYATLEEPLKLHTTLTKKERDERILELARLVSLDENSLSRFPHEFSGGQAQRIAIARALAVDPSLIIADEAVSALDVSIQAQILNLMLELKEKLKLSYLFISHDLAVIHHIADRVAVMYLGEIVEEGTSEEVVRKPLHPYTQALTKAIPHINAKADIEVLEGDVPSPANPPSGCRFHTRCPKAQKRCSEEKPLLKSYGDRKVRCHFIE